MKKIKGKSFNKYLKSKLSDKSIAILIDEVKMHLKIARTIENLRIEKNYTQVQLSKKAGVSQPMIARIERGDQNRIPTLATINKILNALGYEVNLTIKKAA